MREIARSVFQLEEDFYELKKEIKRLVDEPILDTFKIIELCSAMNHIMNVTIILGEIDEKEKVKSIAGYN